MPKNRVNRPVILGIVGDSAAGKTTLTAGIAAILGADRVATICTDDYHRYSRAERAENGVSALDPRGNHVDIMEQHMRLLREGRPILKPVYGHGHGTLEAPEYVEPKPYIIAEGLLGYTTRGLRDCYDVKVFLDPDEDLRVRWKIQRDTAKRGYTRDAVLASLEKRRNDSPAFIRPQRTFADIIVRFHPPQGAAEETGGRLNVRHVLRPTLPHPDLSPILDRGANAGLNLTLARDADGKPVDVLEISGGVPADRAEKLEDLLWTLIPEAGHLRANVGSFDAGRPISHPLALTQLFIAYHMVKAALGVHAV